MSDAASQCRAANRAFRRENPHLERQHLLTRGAMCDLTPPCVTDMLFQHEFYWGRHASMAGPPIPPGTLTPRADWRSRCRTWTRDEDWPTVEPHLSRKGASARRRAPHDFWDAMALLPNRTVWLHGDSIQLQVCNAAFCSLMRTGSAPYPVFSPAAKPAPPTTCVPFWGAGGGATPAGGRGARKT